MGGGVILEHLGGLGSLQSNRDYTGSEREISYDLVLLTQFLTGFMGCDSSRQTRQKSQHPKAESYARTWTLRELLNSR